MARKSKTTAAWADPDRLPDKGHRSALHARGRRDEAGFLPLGGVRHVGVVADPVAADPRPENIGVEADGAEDEGTETAPEERLMTGLRLAIGAWVKAPSDAKKIAPLLREHFQESDIIDFVNWALEIEEAFKEEREAALTEAAA